MNLLLTLRYHGVGRLHAEADTPEELALLKEEFSGFAALEMELAG